MLNNIKITQNTNEIILTMNVVAEVDMLCEELKEKVSNIKVFYITSKIPIIITGKLFTDS